jgi:hypothetical protein
MAINSIRKLWVFAAALAIATTLCAVSWAQSNFQMQFTDIHGQSWNGSLVSVDMESLVYKPAAPEGVADASKRIDEILGIQRVGAKPTRSAVPANWTIGLIDGTLLAVRKIDGKEKDWTVELGDDQTQNGFSGEIRFLKLKKLEPKSEEAWEAYLREDLKSDALIVVRPGGALDRVDGVVKGIRDGKILFDVDGQIVEASVDRLAGVLWYRKQASAAFKGIRVQLSNGSALVAQKATVVDGSLQVAGSWGNSLQVPIDWLESIDCGLDKLAWVSNLATLESRSLRRSGFGNIDAVLSTTLKPRWVKGQGSSGDLLFPGPGEYLFRAPEGMTKLQTRLDRASDSDVQSAILVEVWVDDRMALKKELAAETQSMEIDAVIAPEKKIKLVVGSKSALNLGTQARMLQPRVSK